jgi:hypothetical protein
MLIWRSMINSLEKPSPDDHIQHRCPRNEDEEWNDFYFLVRGSWMRRNTAPKVARWEGGKFVDPWTGEEIRHVYDWAPINIPGEPTPMTRVKSQFRMWVPDDYYEGAENLFRRIHEAMNDLSGLQQGYGRYEGKDRSVLERNIDQTVADVYIALKGKPE